MSILESHGLTPENLRQWLSLDPLSYLGASPRPEIGGVVAAAPAGKDSGVVGTVPQPLTTEDETISVADRRIAMLQRHRSRIQEGMQRNFSEYKAFFAMDQAWDTPFHAISPTLVRQFLSTQDANSEDVYRAAKEWGLTNLIHETKDPKTGKPVKTFNMPMFFEVVVPLVRSYVTIRWAKIMNDRRLTPFWKYEPIKSTAELQLKCDALTDRVQIMAQQYGYFETVKQAVFQMLHYSYCYLFPKEEWHIEEQLKEADELDVKLERKKDDDTPANVGDEIRVRVREGIRYKAPHPSRVIKDLAHAPHTLNTDSGCEYGGYWHIERYRDVMNSSMWNRDKIALGTQNIIADHPLFFQTVYSACTLTIPTQPQTKTPDGPVLGAELGLGAGNLDRERQLATVYYGTEHGDQGVLVVDFFEKLIPYDNGLGDYKDPVWFRFVYAGDQTTCLYAAPLPYCPIIYYGYDSDGNRSKNASLTMEILPFQDHFSNLLTQILHTAKENLANITFIDEDQVDKETVDKIRNMGDAFYRFLNIFKFSSRKAARGLNRVSDVVTRFDLPKGNVAELITAMRTVLEILERVLVMSSQEVAQAAAHELRVDEVRNIAQSTSSRLQFTAVPVDIARDAHKRQIYQGLMAYGDPDWYVHIPAEIPLTRDVMAKMGFNFDEAMPGNMTLEDAMLHRKDRFIRARVKKHATAMNLWEFASSRDGEDRMDNSKTAQAMAVIVQTMVNSPFVQNLGPDQFIDVLNRVMRLAGLPMDVKLKNVLPPTSPEQQQQQQVQQLQKVAQMVLEQVNQQWQTELKPLLDKTKENSDGVQRNSQEIDLVLKALNIGQRQNGNGAPMPDRIPS